MVIYIYCKQANNSPILTESGFYFCRNQERIYALKKKLTALILAAGLSLGVAGCSTEADQVRYNLSQEADNFNIQRKLTVFNIRTDTVLFQMEGTFALSTSSRDELEVTVQTGENEFKRHFISLPDEVAYVMEDISGADVDKYHYEINFLPAWGFKVTNND